MRSRFRKVLLNIGLGIASFASVESIAAPVSFDFTQSPISSGGTLTYTGVQNPPAITVTVSANGGVLTSTSDYGLGVGSDKLIGNHEAVTFDFTPQTVALDYVIFTAVNSSSNQNANNGDTVNIRLLDGSGATLYDGAVLVGKGKDAIREVALVLDGNANQTLPNGVVPGVVLYNLDASKRTGMRFSIGGNDGNDGFGIGGMTVDAVSIDAAAAPSPAPFAGSTALLALCCGGYFYKRFSRSAAAD